MRRPRRTKPVEPQEFIDNVPEGPACLPPAPIADLEAPHQPGIRNRIKRILKSPRNVFGLSRRYFAVDFPSHDPDAESTAQESLDAVEEGDDAILLPPVEGGPGIYGPYPNQSSFNLGEWFWNTGVQKSKSDFRNLLGIITDPTFSKDEICNTRWDRIDKLLGDSEVEGEWLDEPDAGWMKTPITIQVPFPYRNVRDRYCSEPIPPQDFTITDFYHRSIVSILKERIQSEDALHFHMEPYELHWQPGFQTDEPVRVQGEIYTSPAFLDAHNALQEKSGEPGCDLPRVVVALMFASDATQLTSFGQARVWPLYMNFGNDSKYRRSKPSLHLCNHVAYFQKVNAFPFSVLNYFAYNRPAS